MTRRRRPPTSSGNDPWNPYEMDRCRDCGIEKPCQGGVCDSCAEGDAGDAGDLDLERRREENRGS